MARTDLPVASVARTGVASGSAGSEVTGDSTNNHSFTNDTGVFLHVRNSAGTATRTVTLVVAQTVDGQAVTNPTVTVPINSEKLIGPFPSQAYNQPNDPGKVYINVDHADLKLQAFKVSPAN